MLFLRLAGHDPKAALHVPALQRMSVLLQNYEWRYIPVRAVVTGM